MNNKNISQHDKYFEQVQKFAAEIDSEQKVVYIYATTEDCLKAEKSFALKNLKMFLNTQFK